MFWKLSNEFFNERVFLKCNASVKQGDRSAALRSLILIRILTDSANGMYWTGADELSKILKAPINTVKSVWETCEIEHVLNDYENGFNASKWLTEKGYIGYKTENKQVENKQTVAASTSRNFFMS